MMPYRVTQASQRANASPSVSLERGNYRIHAPNSRPLPALLQGNRTSDQRTVRNDPNRSLAFLLFLLVVACFACFGSAYYLFTTRWAHRPVKFLSSEANSKFQVNASTFIDLQEGMHRRYLTYLPHSGFHNQRIAFENALLLAYALRRTLLIPPIRLGNKPMRYVEFHTLMRYYELSSKDGLQHCLQVPPYISRPLECLQYFETTYLPWNWLVNISALLTHQHLIQPPSTSHSWMRKNLHLRVEDTYTLRDESAYQFRFLDTDSDSSPTRDRYSHDVYFNELAAVKEPLLQIGTLFGTTRLRLKTPENLAYQRTIRSSMLFVNKDLVEVAASIARSLNGVYIAVHLRTGDGHFRSKVEKNMLSIWWKVLSDVLGFPPSAKCDLEIRFTGVASGDCSQEPICVGNSTTCPLPVNPPSRSFSSLNIRCRSPRHREPAYHLLNIPLYVATDLRNPELHPDLLLLRQTFPCIFFLGDFANKVRRLDPLRSPYDGVGLKPFLLPFVDAMVASRALKVVGTEGSTFSKYVSEILWASYHKAEQAEP